MCRVDVDLRADDDVAEVERARDRRHDDAQPERRALIRAGQVQRAFLIQRVPRPAPAATVIVPIRDASRHVPSEAWGSGQSGTPVRIPDRPGGVVTWIPARSCSRSSRSMCDRQRAELPRVRVRRPRAEGRGRTGCVAGHGSPAPFQSIVEREHRVRIGRDRACSTASDPRSRRSVPHACGVASGARRPLLNFSSRSLNGTCGVVL